MPFSNDVRPCWHHFGLACVLTGCSLLYDPGEQCDVDSDCIRLARSVSALEGTYCEQHACVQPQLPSGACESNAQCVEQNRGGSAICRDYACIALESDGCALTLNAKALKQAEDVIVLGAFSALGEFNPYDHPGVESIALATAQMQERVGGAVGYLNASQLRPLVFVVCDAKSPSNADAAFDHLTRTLKVPVAVSAFQPTVLRDQWNRLGNDPQVDTLFINALATDSSLSQLQTKRHIWSLLGDPLEALAPAYLALTQLQIGKVPLDTVHLLVVVNSVPAMQDIANYLVKNLLLNGKSLAEAPRDTFQMVPVVSDLVDDSSAASAVARALDEVDPDVVVALGGKEVVGSAILNNEARTPTARTAATGAARYYVLSHHLYNLPELTQSLPNSIDADRIENRMLGINFAAARDSALYRQYLLNLTTQALLDGVPAAAQPGYENYYDAALYAMLSVIGVASQQPTRTLTGSRAIEGFERITDMTATGTQPGLSLDQLPAIASALEGLSTTRLAVTGTLGPPDFDDNTFSRRMGASVWCLRQNTTPVDGTDGWEWVSDFARFDPVTARFDPDPDACPNAVPK